MGYCFATAIYLMAETSYFDFLEYMKRIVRFNAPAPMYFVLLYLQLMLAFHPLVVLLDKIGGGVLYEIYLLIAVAFVAILTTRWTNVLDVYGGGGKVLSGTYLLLYYVGMLIEKHKLLDTVSVKKSVLFALLFGGLWFVWWRYQCRYQLVLEEKVGYIFGQGFNPPGLTFMVSGVCMLFFSYGIFTLIEKNYIGKYFVNFVNYCGRHTMYIFLYHLLILRYLLRYVIVGNIWIKRFLFIFLMVGCSILIEEIVKKIMDAWKKLNFPIEFME